jgi:hypothetical protein
MVFSGCNTDSSGGNSDDNKTPPEQPAHSGLKALQNSLNAVGPGDSAHPNTIALSSGIRIPQDWGAVNDAVKNAQKYVVLDMSACPVDGGRLDSVGGTDQFNHPTPAPNDTNIIHDNIYIKGLVLPSGVTEIGYMAFHGCQYLSSVVFPAILSEIGEFAFGASGVFRLKEIVFKSGNVSFNEHNSFSSLGSNLKALYQANGAGAYLRDSLNSATWRYESR